jgi:hypothetical protein
MKGSSIEMSKITWLWLHSHRDIADDGKEYHGDTKIKIAQQHDVGSWLSEAWLWAHDHRTFRELVEDVKKIRDRLKERIGNDKYD